MGGRWIRRRPWNGPGAAGGAAQAHRRETAVSIIQKPHFYRTSWFLGCALLMLVATVWGGHKFRMRQAHARFQAVLDERTRLAREMHDTLIQGCAGVSALLEAHSSLAETEPSGKDDLLTCARSQLRTTINEAREAVWDLRHADGSATAVVPMLASMVQQVSEEFGVPVEYHVAGNAFDLDQSTAHELLMVVREALHNAIRHGQPARVHVNVDFESNELTVEIRDDGRGFDPALASASPNGHYGLIGMRERMKRLGGKLILNSRVGSGTVLTMHLPSRASVTEAARMRI